MARLAKHIENLEDHYDVVIIGSGYGGSIAASRLARAGRKVCILERGREFRPGEYPDTESEVLSQLQLNLPEARLGTQNGLYDFHVNPEINVFKGCGLGGTSLVNANVAICAEPRVYEDPRWPDEVRGDGDLLKKCYAWAEEMLRPVPYPTDQPLLKKLTALEESAAGMGPFYRPPINVNFKEGVNQVGVPQHVCTGCGDCVTGCNYAAKNTLIMNYLPDAKNHGASIFTEVDVRHIAHRGDGWTVHCRILDSGREAFKDAPLTPISADIVILAGGVLGTADVLFRSRQHGLTLSDRLGERFTGNGDVLAFCYNAEDDLNAVGYGSQSPKGRENVGPCITGIIDLRDKTPVTDGIVIEEGSFPGAISGVLPIGLAFAAKIGGTDTTPGIASAVAEHLREWESLALGPYKGAIRNTQVYLVMTHDSGKGKLEFVDDRVHISWPHVGDEPIFEKVGARILECSKALEGTYVKNPIWSKLLKHSLITVHPLGGSVMGADASSGVVDHKHRVFSSAAGKDVHPGLYVCDGSVVPLPLGVNPLLTICGLAERCCHYIAADNGWTIPYAFPPVQAQEPELTPVGLEFAETMRGHVTAKEAATYEMAEALGIEDDTECEFTLTVIAEDLDAFIKDENHGARMIGTLICGRLSAEPMSATGGLFNQLVENPDRPDSKKMLYKLGLRSVEGKSYTLEGFKLMVPDPVWLAWKQTSTLYVTIREGEDGTGAVVAKGILHILPADFMHEMTTMKALNAGSVTERLRALGRFGEFFAGSLFPIYGGVFSRNTPFNPGAPPRKKRPLRVGAPEVHEFKTDEAKPVALRMTRYKGGTKGPVMVTHGLGVSSQIFTIDTIETNLLEYLYANGYDIWLLDYRNSVDLPSATELSTADDVATKDYPGAVKTILGITGAPSLQVVAHCYGSTTFNMAMLAGLKGVRSAVCSQVGMHVETPAITDIKCWLHVPDFLEDLGFSHLTSNPDDHPSLWERLFDTAIKVQPVPAHEGCNSPVCHRITFLYSILYRHDSLNQATHEALHEMFGVGNIQSFEHLGVMVRKHKLVNFEGDDAYFPGIANMAIPLCYISGADNRCYLPIGTQKTFELLVEKNGPDLYTRHVVPGYGHIDCIFGKNASRDVYPLILGHLEKTAKV